MKSKLISFLLLFAICSSCGQVKKEIAGDQLLGTFTAKASYTFLHSAQNIGWDDETSEAEGTIKVYKSSNGEIFITTGDGNVKLAAITLASNGTTFNIPYQSIVQQDGSTKLVQGFQCAELEGMKFDGIYYTESNILSFGYETTIPYDYWGTTADVRLICAFECSKYN